VSTTPQDWRVTADIEVGRCIDLFTAARTDRLNRLEVLQRCWSAYQAAAAAVGAAVESELRAGVDMATMADLLGFADAGAAEAGLAEVRRAADERLHDRLRTA
jgi:hypothetical protein